MHTQEALSTVSQVHKLRVCKSLQWLGCSQDLPIYTQASMWLFLESGLPLQGPLPLLLLQTSHPSMYAWGLRSPAVSAPPTHGVNTRGKWRGTAVPGEAQKQQPPSPLPDPSPSGSSQPLRLDSNLRLLVPLRLTPAHSSFQDAWSQDTQCQGHTTQHLLGRADRRCLSS